jgi:hypothetical protein
MKIDFYIGEARIHDRSVEFVGSVEGSHTDIVLSLPIDDPRCEPYRRAPVPLPADDVLGALREFARTHGRCWKSKLRRLWETGQDAHCSGLRRARNVIGPSGLDNIKL